MLTFMHVLIFSAVTSQVVQNGGFEEGDTVTNISQIYNADYWEYGCDGSANLFDCNAPPIFGIPGPSLVGMPADCIYPRSNGSLNCRFGSVTVESQSNSSSESTMNRLSGNLLANVPYEIQLFAARGTKPPAANQPTYRRIEAVLRIGNCDDEIIVPIPIDIPFGNCDWIQLNANFELTVNEASFGYNYIEFREVTQIVFNSEEIYIDDVVLIVGVADLQSEETGLYSSKWINIYPNPANSVLNIETGELISRAVIMDLTGKEMIISSNTNTISVENLSIGSYLIKLYSQDGSEACIQRFVKQ